MYFLIVALIIFFSYLIINSTILAYYPTYENYKNYENYDTSNNVMILAQKNAGNIEVLKDQIDKLQPIVPVVHDLSGNVALLQSQVNQIIQAQSNYGHSIAGSKPANISGTS